MTDKRKGRGAAFLCFVTIQTLYRHCYCVSVYVSERMGEGYQEVGELNILSQALLSTRQFFSNFVREN